MILTTKGRYAVLAALYIAKYGEGKSVPLSEISSLQNISLNYLEQIFAKLRKAGVVESIRGPGGGYKLSKSPDEIYIYQITKSVEEKIKITQCGNKRDKACLPKAVKCMAHDLWRRLEDNVKDFLRDITLSDVIGRVAPNIYLDYNATSPTLASAARVMMQLLRDPANASSTHFHGRKAKGILENARDIIADKLGIKTGRDAFDICFCSSGTEANNLLLHNFIDRNIVLTSIEHLSILEPSALNSQRIIVEVDADGLINLESFEEIARSLEKPSLISVIYANNETGIIQDLKTICGIAHKYNHLVHSDLVQAFGKISCNIAELGLDFATISSHKIGGPLGAAALIHRSNFVIKSQIVGGGQEKGRRAGTENLPAIAGFAEAAKEIDTRITKLESIKNTRDFLESQIKEICPNAIIFSSDKQRLPNTSMISMLGVDIQTQLIYFDINGISISSGAACSSGKVVASHVVRAMGYSELEAKSAIRVSLGPETQIEEIQKFISIWKNLWEKNNKKVA